MSDMSGYFNGLVVCQMPDDFNNPEGSGKIIQASTVSGSLVTKMRVWIYILISAEARKQLYIV